MKSVHGPVGVVNRYGQWVVDLIDYLVMEYCTPFVTVLLAASVQVL